LRGCIVAETERLPAYTSSEKENEPPFALETKGKRVAVPAQQGGRSTAKQKGIKEIRKAQRVKKIRARGPSSQKKLKV